VLAHQLQEFFEQDLAGINRRVFPF